MVEIDISVTNFNQKWSLVLDGFLAVNSENEEAELAADENLLMWIDPGIQDRTRSAPKYHFPVQLTMQLIHFWVKKVSLENLKPHLKTSKIRDKPEIP